MGGWEVNPNLNMGVDQLRKAMIVDCDDYHGVYQVGTVLLK